MDAVVKEQFEAMMSKIQELETKLVAAENEMKIATTISPPKAIAINEGDTMVNFKFFKTQWNNFVTASGLDKSSEKVKKATLLTAIGEECLRIYENLPLTDADKETADSLLDAIEKHLTPSVNIRYERALFNLAKQNDDESYDTYINRLRGLIKKCEYGQLEEDLLLDKIIYSVKSIPLREQLWSNKKITLTEAISKCKSKELFTKQMKEVGDTLYDEETKEEVNKVYQKKRDNKKQQSENVDCGFCGRTHERNKRKCPAFGEICNKCKIRNHFSRMCKSTQQKYKKIKEINTDSDDSSDFVLTVTSEKRNLKSELYMKINKNNFMRTECMLDTGATCNIKA